MESAKFMFVEGIRNGRCLDTELKERLKDIECTKHLLTDPRLDLAVVNKRYDFVIIELNDVSDREGNRFQCLHQQLHGLKNFLDDLEAQRRILYGCKVMVVIDQGFPYLDYLSDMLLDAEKRLVNMTLSLLSGTETPIDSVDKFVEALMLMKPVSSKFKIN